LVEIAVLVITCLYLQVVVSRDKAARRRKRSKRKQPPPSNLIQDLLGEPLYTWLCLRYCPPITKADPEPVINLEKVIFLTDYKPRKIRNLEKLPVTQHQL
jgi:hypothetical protein